MKVPPPLRTLAALSYGLLVLGCGGEEPASGPADTSSADTVDVVADLAGSDAEGPGDLPDAGAPEVDAGPVPDPPEVSPDPPETGPPDTLTPNDDATEVMEDTWSDVPDTGDAGPDGGDALGDAVDTTDALEVVELPPPPPEPIAWYGFEVTEGPVLDSSGNELHGTATGWGVTRGEPGVNGGLAVSFDGTGGRVLIDPNPLFELTDGFTLEAWVKPTSIEDQQTVVHMGSVGGNEISLALLQGEYPVGDVWGPGGRIRVSISSPKPSLNNDLTVVNTTDIAIGPEGAWFHIAVTNDGGAMRLYGNGNLFFEGPPGVYMGDMDEQVVRIGGDDYDNQIPNPFVGLVDDVRWWNVAREPVEICEGLGGLILGGSCALPDVSPGDDQ